MHNLVWGNHTRGKKSGNENSFCFENLTNRGTSNIGFQNNKIIEEKLTVQYIQKVSKRDIYVEKFREYKREYKRRYNKIKKYPNEIKYKEDINKFIEDMKLYNKKLKNDEITKEEYLNNATIGDEVIIEYNSRKKDYIVKKVLKSDDKTYVGEIKFKGNTCYVINDELGNLEVLNPIDIVDGHIVTFKKIYGNIIIEDIICHKNEANSDIMKIVYKHDFIASISDKIKKELDNIPDYLVEKYDFLVKFNFSFH